MRLFILALVLICSVVALNHFASSNNNNNNETMTTTTTTTNDRRQLRVLSDPKTVVHKTSIPISEQYPPRRLHLCLLGDPTPRYMLRVAHWVNKRIMEQGFDDVWVWSDDKANYLFEQELGGDFLRVWNAIKTDEGPTRLARMTDFLRLVIMYEYGGVYLDVDILPCHGLEFMVDKPGVVSFPYLNEQAGEVVNCAISSPPKHPFMQLALHNLFAKDMDDLAHGAFLRAAGPHFVSTVVDEYLERKNVAFPSIANEEAVPFPFSETERWTEVDDLRFANFGDLVTQQEFAMVHMHMGSWFQERAIPKCEQNVELIPSFLDKICEGTITMNARFYNCGEE